MASQIKHATPGNEYSVVDNGPAPSFPTLNANSHVGYDTVNTGATSHGSNPFSNGSIPGFIASGATTVLNNPASATIKYRNPA